MSKPTTREKILQVMEWDIPFHLTELQALTGVEYGGVSKEITNLLKEEIIERIGSNSGIYIKFSKRGKIKYKLTQIADKILLKESYLIRLRDEYKSLIIEKAALEKELEALDEDYN